MIDFIIYLSTFFVVIWLFNIIWKYAVVFPLTLVSVLIRMENLFSYIIKPLQVYFVVSLTGLLTAGYINQFDSIFLKVFIGFMASFFMFIYFANSIYLKAKNAREQMDYETYESINFDYILMFISVPLFILVLLIPQISTFIPLNMYFYQLMDWLYNLQTIGNIIKWGLSIFGVVLSIVWTLNGIMYLLVLIRMLFSAKSRQQS